MRAAIVTAVIAASAAQAQLIYPHSPSEEKTANAVSEGLAKAKAAHLGAIDRHRTFLSEAQARERRLLTQRELAQRDARMAYLLNGNNLTVLRSDIQERLALITGLRDDALARFSAAGQLLAGRALDIDLLRDTLDQDTARLARTIRVYQADGGKGTYCRANGLPEPTTTTPGVATTRFAIIESLCRQMVAQDAEFGRVGRGLGPEALALLGRPTEPGQLAAGEIRNAVEESASLARLVEQQALLVTAAKAHLKQLEDYYKCQQRRAEEPGVAAKLQAAAEQIRNFIDLLSNISSDTFSDQLRAADETPAEEPAADTCQDDAGVRHDRPAEIGSGTELAEAANLSGADFIAALSAVSHLQPARTLLAGVREAAQEFRASKLSEVLGVIAGEDPDPDSDSQRAAASIVRLIGHVEQFQRARAGTLPDTAGVLVRLAGARMRSSAARIEADRLQRLKRLADLRVAALRREVLDLLAAHRFAQAPAGFSQALIRYSDSWANGRMPNQIISYDMRSARYLAWLDRERVAVEAAYGVLEPGVAQLQAYGAGGFRAAEVAQILSSVGLGAIALGE